MRSAAASNRFETFNVSRISFEMQQQQTGYEGYRGGGGRPPTGRKLATLWCGAQKKNKLDTHHTTSTADELSKVPTHNRHSTSPPPPALSDTPSLLTAAVAGSHTVRALTKDTTESGSKSHLYYWPPSPSFFIMPFPPRFLFLFK